MSRAAKNVSKINWQIANNWQVLLREMKNQIAPTVAKIRQAQGKLDKSMRKTGPTADVLNWNLGKLQSRLRFWKATTYEALSLYDFGDPPAPAFLVEAFSLVRLATVPPLPSVADQAIFNPDITRETLAAMQQSFLYLQQAMANMRQGITTGQTRTTAQAAQETAQRSPASDAYNPPSEVIKIPWWLLLTGLLGYLVAKQRRRDA